MKSLKIGPEQLRKIEAAARRQELIDQGLSLLPANKVHKMRTAWKRKGKHKPDYND